MPIIDRLSRPLRDLRISVTDRCNFRCRYCMPAEVFGDAYTFLPKSEILTLEEAARLAGVFCKLGVEKLRITGGEPLLRRGLSDLVTMLAAIPEAKDIALTTNGTLLTKFSNGLKTAGLQRVTVSLDALDSDIFSQMNGVGAAPEKVICGIDAALSAGLGVKINSVIQKGVNESEILTLAKFARQRGVTLRFIEFMDAGNTNGWKQNQVVPYTEIVQTLHRYFPLEAIDPNYPGETARRFKYKDFPDQEVGFITSVSNPFCRDCNRIRLSADGHLYTCLFASTGYDIRTALRDSSSDEELAELITRVWQKRDDQYSELHRDAEDTHAKPEMSYIGG